MSKVNDIQEAILNALFLESTFEQLKNEIETTLPILRDELRIMIDKGWIHVLERPNAQADYKRIAIFDSDQLEKYAFVATKKGLDKVSTGNMS